MNEKSVEQIIIETEKAIIDALNKSNLSVGILELIVRGIHSQLRTMTLEEARKEAKEDDNTGI